MTRIELATPLRIGAIVTVGISAGIVTGIMGGPAGAILGLCAGAAVGAIAGKALQKEEAIRSVRSRELDEEIGVLGGDLGAAPVSIPPSSEEQDEAQARERWLAEWLTPPPPVAG